ncbi:MAG: FAD-dependent oxidoreductase [Mycobacteriales bacterium]
MTRPLRVAVVGAGPAGLYAADYLSFDQDGSVLVDLIERLPVPFGLLRYGVAPDHLNIKSAGNALMEVLQRPGVSLYAHVDVGRDVTVAELRERYDAVIYAMGASGDRKVGIPGEDLDGSISATSFVNWYNGHPEALVHDLEGVTTAAVIGVGNVAVDVARLLLKDPEQLLDTDAPHEVVGTFRKSAVTDVHVLGRRGAQHAKFTYKELRELGELTDVDVAVDAADLPAEPPEGASPGTKRNLALLRQWATREPTGARRRLHLHFGALPVEVLGDQRITALRVEHADVDGNGTGRTWDLPVQLLLRSVGYRSAGLPGVPFDDRTCTIPAAESRVIRDGSPQPGEYVVGWIGRGPTGILGTNRADADDAVARLREDAAVLLDRRPEDPGGVAELLHRRGVQHVDLAGWQAVLDAEEKNGVPHGRGRVKLTEWQALLDAAHR